MTMKKSTVDKIKFYIKPIIIIGLIISLIFSLTMIKKVNLLYLTWIISGIIVVLGIIIIFVLKGTKSPPTTKPGTATVTTSPRDKGAGKATFTDFCIFIIFIVVVAYLVLIFKGDAEIPFKKYLGIKEKIKDPIEKVIVNKKPLLQSIKEKIWKLDWQKPNNVYGSSLNNRRCSFEIKFLRRDQYVMEFISMINGLPSEGTHAFLTTENQKVGRKWKGTYIDEKTKETGFMGFDEIPGDNGEIMYIGEHSDGQMILEWIPTVIKLKTK